VKEQTPQENIMGEMTQRGKALERMLEAPYNELHKLLEAMPREGQTVTRLVVGYVAAIAARDGAQGVDGRLTKMIQEHFGNHYSVPEIPTYKEALGEEQGELRKKVTLATLATQPYNVPQGGC